MTDWIGFYYSLARHVRASGWTCTVIVRDFGFRPIGTRTVLCASLTHDNDNHG